MVKLAFAAAGAVYLGSEPSERDLRPCCLVWLLQRALLLLALLLMSYSRYKCAVSVEGKIVSPILTRYFESLHMLLKCTVAYSLL